MKDAKTFWDKAALKYAKAPIDDMDGYLQTLERTKSYLSPTDKILEIGCGTGSTAILLSEHVSHITANDLSTEMIAIGQDKADRAGLTNIKFVAGDVMDTRFTAAPFDVVLAHNVLHLIQDAPSAIGVIYKAVKPGGLFISKTVCKFGQGTPLKYKIIKFILPVLQALGKAPFVAFRDKKDFDKMIEGQGFTIIETGDYPSRYIVARKPN